MRISIALGIIAAMALSVGVASGQDDPIKARQALMKSNGAQAKIASDMIKGTTPYDAAAATAAMTQIVDNITKFPTLFPAGSDAGETKASPAIWENMDDFKAKAAKLAEDAKAAGAAAASGVEAFQAAFGAVGGDCGACHKAYRKS